MKPKEKAKELVSKMLLDHDMPYDLAQECALIAVDEILDASIPYFDELDDYVIFWQQVKKEILAL